MQVTIGQEVACMSNRGRLEGFYSVIAITPKGNKITVQRDNDGYKRTFDQNGNETDTVISKQYRSYLRTDVDAIRLAGKRDAAIQTAASALYNIDTLRNVARGDSKEFIVEKIAQMKIKLAEVEALVELIP